MKDLLSAVVASGRSSTHAQIKLQLNLSADGDENSLFAGTAPISAATNVNGNLPQTVPGAGQAMSYPYFQIVLAVLGDNSAEEYVDCDIYVGGKQY